MAPKLALPDIPAVEDKAASKKEEDFLKRVRKQLRRSSRLRAAGRRFKKYRRKAVKLSKKVGRLAWKVGTSAVILALPLLMEVTKEQQLLELQQQQIAQLRSQGYTRDQLRQMGLPA